MELPENMIPQLPRIDDDDFEIPENNEPEPQQFCCNECQSRQQQLLSIVQDPPKITINLLCLDCGSLNQIFFILNNNSVIKKSKVAPSYIN